MKKSVKKSRIKVNLRSRVIGERDLTEILKKQHDCDECGSSSLVDMKTGSEICRNCGLVLKNKLYTESHDFFDIYFNNYNVNSFPTSHTFKDPSLISQFQLKSVQEINYRNNYRRLIKLQKRSNFLNERNPNFFRGLKEIQIICAKLNLANQIEEEAALIFRKVSKANITKGRSIEKICTSCIYLAHKCRNVQPPLNELLTGIDGFSRKELIRLSKFLAEKTNLIINNHVPRNFLLQFINNGNLPKILLGESLKILDRIKELNEFQGKSPQSITAAALYLSSKKLKMKISQEKIAKIAQISRKTINQRVNEVKQELSLY